MEITGNYARRIKSWVNSKIAAIVLSTLADVDNSAIANDRFLQYKSATGKHEYVVGGGGVTDHGALTGLADDDHPQYTSDAEVDAIVLTHKNIAAAHHAKTVSGDIDIHLAKDVEDAAIGDDKILVWKAGASEHVYEANTGAGTTGHGFSAYRSTQQSIPHQTTTTMVYNTENFDPDNDYDVTNGRYTPQVAGYYIATGCVCVIDINDGTKFVIKLNKNAVVIGLDRGVIGGTEYAGGTCTAVVYMNGSTDFLTVSFHHDHGSARNTSATPGVTSFSAWILPAP